MKKAVLLTTVLALSFSLFSGCATIQVKAPPGQDVRLLSEDDPIQTKIQTRAWYVLWGLVPISDISTDVKIAEQKLTGVRVTEYYGFIDVLLDMVLGIVTVHTRTVEIEGTR